MKTKRGSVLVMTVGFMLVFTLLGFGAMSYSGFQGQGIVIKTMSTQGFWLAEAGVQQAISHLTQKGVTRFTIPNNLLNDPPRLSPPPNWGTNPPNWISNPPVRLGEGYYAFVVEPLSLVRWKIDSFGTVLPVSNDTFHKYYKEILVEYGPDVKNFSAIQSTGDLSNVPAVFYTSKDAPASFTPSEVFGRDLNSVIGLGTQINYSGKDLSSFTGITVVTVPSNTNTVSFNQGHGQGILIVKPAHEGDSFSFKLSGSAVFDGVVWLQSSTDPLAPGWGNAKVNGEVFISVDANPGSINGSPNFVYDQTKIDNALASTVTKFKVVSWQEVT